jgi:hypothetical protein
LEILSCTNLTMLPRFIPGCAQASETALARVNPQSLSCETGERNFSVTSLLSSSPDGAPAALDAPAPRNSVHSPLPIASRICDGISMVFSLRRARWSDLLGELRRAGRGSEGVAWRKLGPLSSDFASPMIIQHLGKAWGSRFRRSAQSLFLTRTAEQEPVSSPAGRWAPLRGREGGALSPFRRPTAVRGSATCCSASAILRDVPVRAVSLVGRSGAGGYPDAPRQDLLSRNPG